MAIKNPNISPNLVKAKALWANQVCNLAKNNLVRAHKVATGSLGNSISYAINLQTGAIEFSYDEYGEFVEKGRRPGKMPPIGPIQKWAKVKGLKGRDKKTGRFITDKSLAWAIATSIKRDGIRAFPFFQMALTQATEQLYNDLENALAADIEANLSVEELLAI
jgi:hypothetical protein